VNPTKKQMEFAEKLNIYVSKNDTYRTLKANLLDEISDAIEVRVKSQPTEEQSSYAKSLGITFNKDSFRLLSAKIADELEKRNMDALKTLNLKIGDVVLKKGMIIIKPLTVSSIKSNGKIYFKGGGGKQAWASQIERIIKRN